ncbi:hypothetical protein GJ496_010442 [Pomphorhynchus laevis]|nr:hypothetical protein GJ496_010442 [Pomphorhynchus laevis]
MTAASDCSAIRRCPCPTSPGRSLPQITRNIGKPRMCRLTHIIQTVLHLIQLTISYILMLIAMTYNVYLFGAVVLGAATGHFIFAWKRTTLLDCTEHCH